jgi:hypothetical protein
VAVVFHAFGAALEEAGRLAGVAGRAGRIDEHQQGVTVAVDAQLAHLSTLPLSSPFFHSSARERDQKWAKPVSSVRASASAFIHATISTAPVVASWATAGTSPRSSKTTACMAGS